MKLVHAYMSDYALSVTVHSNSFQFSNNSNYTSQDLPLSLSEPYDFYDVKYDLDSAERAVEVVKEERRAAEERERKKAFVLSRLTAEEKELLGL